MVPSSRHFLILGLYNAAFEPIILPNEAGGKARQWRSLDVVLAAHIAQVCKLPLLCIPRGHKQSSRSVSVQLLRGVRQLARQPGMDTGEPGENGEADSASGPEAESAALNLRRPVLYGALTEHQNFAWYVASGDLVSSLPID